MAQYTLTMNPREVLAVEAALSAYRKAMFNMGLPCAHLDALLDRLEDLGV